MGKTLTTMDTLLIYREAMDQCVRDGSHARIEEYELDRHQRNHPYILRMSLPPSRSVLNAELSVRDVLPIEIFALARVLQ